MRKHTLVILATAALLILALAAITTTSRAQDTQRTVSLSPGCNMVTLTFADGTDAAALATAVSPSAALQTAWRLDNATGAWQAFTPQAPQASDLTSLNLLDAVFICVDTSASLSTPSASPDPAGTTFSASLVTGCNAIGLSFPDATSASQVASAVTPPAAFQSIWRYNAAQGSFQAYMAAAPQASDLTSVQFLDAVFLCTTAQGSLEMPALEGMPPLATPPAGAGSPQALRSMMRTAMPQAEDLGPEFEVVEESLESHDLPGPLYHYRITYQQEYTAAIPTGVMISATFDLLLFDTVDNAKSGMNSFKSMSVEDWRALNESVWGGAYGLEVGSVIIEELEAPGSLGEDADYRRIRTQTRPVGSGQFWNVAACDVISIRRDRVVGRVWVWWSVGPPGPESVPGNLAQIMDTRVQEALPGLLAAVP